MELFFPFVGLFAVAVAAIAATAFILIPGPKHLVSKVFFGTIGFIFGGTFCTAVVGFVIARTVDAVFPTFSPSTTVLKVFFSFLFTLLAAGSAWLAIKIFESLIKLNHAVKAGRRRGNLDQQCAITVEKRS